MPTNDQYMAGVGLFNSGEGGLSDYFAPAGEMAGAGEFTAAVLFRLNGDFGESNQRQPAWANTEGAPGSSPGWWIGLDRGVNPPSGPQVSFIVRSSAGAPVRLDFPLDQVVTDIGLAGPIISGYRQMGAELWILAHLRVTDEGKNDTGLSAFVNGTLVHPSPMGGTTSFVTIDGGQIPSTDSARMGADGGNTAGPDLTVAGVAYMARAMSHLEILEHTRSCMQALDMSIPVSTVPLPAADFDNRWSSRDAVDPANTSAPFTLVTGPAGGLPVGVTAKIGTPPPVAPVLSPRAGSIDLTRENDGDNDLVLLTSKNLRFLQAVNLIQGIED